ncbi:PREDICTED: telomere repeat-binding protein 6-like [Camelina sativa]|uniref:Telomere repeat-binding protein 6-like n=1 Tax=Camelina sativa TaxID=90675 RepID=A0ABM1QFQ0_CAMSA|nr:PREDICTED: telomere repeat-binding protein 6-like [Camelina sativa]
MGRTEELVQSVRGRVLGLKLKKTVGFDAYQLPVVPRAYRSPRGRRLKPMRKHRFEFEVLTQVAGELSGECKNAIGSLAHETNETKDDDVVVNNLLETMEVEVKPQPDLEKPSSKVLLSKDWLALGPSMSSSPITEEKNFDSSSKIDGKRKMCNMKERGSCSSQESQDMYPLKKRKLFYQNHRPDTHEAPCTVKFGIKSLKISELLVDIPESATVGSLKLAVLEAVTRILKDGLNIGVLLRGKTIDDDSKTLLQIGIAQDDDHNLISSLGFMLEPHKSETTSGTTLTTVYPATRRQNRVRGPVDSTEAVAAKPARMKPASQPEMVQRRIRRPFTVSEVEALVQAVETLGTGRWRDIKSHAFDHANHRTYVDLKDKWKTLVHTAKISARQRRGEPVPQDLLDRVLAAHAFWSDRTG